MSKDNKTEKLRASYYFFLEKQKTGQSFTIGDISIATGWSKSTINTYMTKKWTEILVRQPQKRFSVNISTYSEEAYVRMMSQNYRQSIDPFKPNLSEEIEELVIKARDSAILAIDIYNRPVINFRSEGYIVMMIIAWTALLHAIFELNGIDYFYKGSDGNYMIIDNDKKAWELARCIDNCDNNLLSPATKKNLQLFISLRNKIVHRYVPALDIDIFGESQAMLLNFESLITKKFGLYYALNNTLTFPLQVSSIRSNEQIKITKKIQSAHYKELKQYIEIYRHSLSDDVYSDNQYSFRVFLIPQIGNHQKSADCAIEFIQYDPNQPEKFERIKKDIALIKEKHISVANQGRYKPQMVCNILSKKLGWKVSIDLHTKAWKYYKIRKPGYQATGCNTEYCQFDEPHKDYVYTQSWIDFLYKKFGNQSELERIKNIDKRKLF